jgi:type I restriction enzyme, S subunit
MSNYKLSIKNYPFYKDSEIEWLGKVPDHWKIRRIKDFSLVVRGGSPRPAGDPKFYEGDIPFLKVGDLTSNEEVYLSTYTHTIKEAGLTNTRFIQKNTLLLTNSGATLGIPKICTFPTAFNDGIAAFIHLNKIDKIFLFYTLKNLTKYYLNQVALGQGQPNLNTDIIGNTFIPCPTLPEQKLIAHYLDTKTAQIDRKIDLLTQKATQYGNLKQSLINETVTRGLDKSVPMKDSAIGEIPKHWEVRRLKDLSDIQNSNVDKKSYADEISVKLCNYVDVYKNDFIDKSLNFMEATATKLEIKQFTIKQGDVFITKDSETCDDIAIPALATESIDGVLCGYHLAQFRIKEKVFLGSYLFRLFQSPSYGFRFVISAKGITRVGLGQSAIADSLTPVPPLSEQKAIADYLDTKTTQIDRIIQTINTQIEKLKELRKTLINDVVIGKIRVTENQS